jgi:DNA-binding NarL/FixJ family response regulator
MTIEPLDLTAAPTVTPIQRGLVSPRRSAHSASRPPESLNRRRVVVAGAATAIVEALAAALAVQAGLEVVSTARNETDLFELIARGRVDGIVLYVPELDMETIEIVTRLKRHDSELRIVMLTAQANSHSLAQAAGAGVAACLSSNARLRDLAEAIRAETTDTMLVDAASLSAPVTRGVDAPDHGALALTRRELEVLSMLADGCSPPVIAADLVISIYTARGHVKSVLRKLGVHSQLEAVAAAKRLGLLDSVACGHSESPERARHHEVTPILAADNDRLCGWRRHA